MYRDGSDVVRDELAGLRAELTALQARIAASARQCRELARKAREGLTVRAPPPAPVTTGAPLPDHASVREEAERLQHAIARAREDAAALRAEERRLRAIVVRRAREPRKPINVAEILVHAIPLLAGLAIVALAAYAASCAGGLGPSFAG